MEIRAKIDVMHQKPTNVKDGLQSTQAKRETWNRLPFTALRRNQSCQHLWLRLRAPQNSETMHVCCLSH